MKALAFYDTRRAASSSWSSSATALSPPSPAGRAAEYYGAEVLEAGIEDNPENYTRFFLVPPRGDAQRTRAANKISIAFSVQNRPGSLVAALNELAASAPTSPRSSPAPSTASHGSTSSTVDCQIQSSAEGSQALEALARHCDLVQGAGPLPRSRPLTPGALPLTSPKNAKQDGPKPVLFS